MHKVSIVGLLVGLLIGTTTRALAQATSTTTTGALSISVVAENPSTGEPMLIQGVTHFVIHHTVDASGGYTQINFGAFTGSALGLSSGTRYRAVNVQLDNQAHFSSEGTAESTDVMTIHFIAEGNRQERFYSQVTLHSTINANGELTTTPRHVHTECR